MFTLTLLGVELYFVLWFFFIFCVLGVIVEMFYAMAQDGVLESRQGMLYLPLSPIYGLGGMIIGLFLIRYLHEPVLLFFVGMLIASVLEYVASWIMEKAFKTVFWDYSTKPLNLHGRICLRYSIYWGLLSLLLIYVVIPPLYRLISPIPRPAGDAILTVMIILTVIAVVITLLAFNRLKGKVSVAHAADLGAQAAFRPGSGVFARVLDRIAPDQLMINTFPRMSLVVEYARLNDLQPLQIPVALRRPARRADLLIEQPSK